MWVGIEGKIVFSI